MRFFTFLSILIILSVAGYSQSCSTIPGMNPATSIPVCGATTFTQNTIASCTGPSIFSACLDNLVTSNSAWYRFHCYQNGALGFAITPQSPTDDYDWTLFDVTGHVDPNDVLTDQSLQISVNLSAITGPTGCSATGIGNINCAGPPSQWNQLANIQVDHDYILLVTNWSNSGLGYTLSFTGGLTTITNNVAPEVDTVTVTSCNTAQLNVLFSKDIRCNSITATGSEFLITPGNFPVSGVTSVCATGSNSATSLVINLQTPLPTGNYNLIVNNGTDANTFTDACDLNVATVQIPFSVIAPTPSIINAVTYSGCAPTVLNVTLSNPIRCNSITTTGSEFSIAGNTITSVVAACGAGQAYTNTLQVVLQNQLPHGNYQLVINTGSDGNTLIDTCNAAIPGGYTFPLVINQSTVAPAIQSVGFNECQPNKVILNFDKPVSCNSLSALGSELSVSPGSWPISAITNNCSNNITTQVTLTFQNNLIAGNYNININNGSDGNTLSDTCFAFIASGYIKSFTATQSPKPIFDSVQYDKCNPAFVKVFYNHPILCSSISADGSDFSITGPSAVTIASATAGCGQGFSNWVLLQLSQPVSVIGNYVLHNGNGSDGNGLIDTCNATQNNLETIAFNILVKPDATFTSPVRWGCINDTIDLSHPGGNAVNSWIWSFTDGTSVTGQNASHYFPVATVTAGIQLIISNGSCSDTATANISLNNAFNADCTIGADTTCSGKPLTFTNNSTGQNLQYQWQFGDNTNFNGHTPPAHSYTNNNSYTIYLIAGNDHGCLDSSIKTVYVTALPEISYGVLNDKYCTAETVSLTASIAGNIDSYTWNGGNGSTFQNVAAVSFRYTRQDNYTITLTANDHFCGITTYSDNMEVYLVPVVDLGNDLKLCPEMRSQIGLPNNPALTYLWSTGAVTSQIVTELSSKTYLLTIDNHGCKGQDEIEVEMLDGCLIRVPGAFTPNNDGTNDKLLALNAFLATEFSLKVYNRFGQLLYATTNPLEGWDGRFKGNEEGPGTFVWLLSYTDPWTHQRVFQKGTSILIR